MDRVKHRRRRSKKPKKVLLSIVDPWDVKVASVEPVTLASRRGVSVSTLISHETSQEWSVLRSPGKIPSPWYKPCTSVSSCTSATKHKNSQSGGSTSPEWPLPWYVPQRNDRTPINDTLPDTVSLPLPVELPSARNCKTKENSDVEKGPDRSNGSTSQNIDPLNKKNLEENLNCELVNGEQLVQIHVEDEKSSERQNEADRVERKRTNSVSGINGIFRLETDNLKIVSDAHELRVTSGEQRSKSALTTNYLRTDSTWTNDNLKLVDHLLEGKNIEIKSDRDRLDRLKNRPNDDPESLVSIVEQLVRARYNPLTTTQRRLDRSPIRNFHKETSQTDGRPTTSTSSVRSALTFTEGQTFQNSDRSANVTKFQTSNIRKSSISMPSQLDDVDSLRMKGQKGTTARSMKTGSESSATFSNSGSTPNESDLDSETEDDVDDNEFAKIPLQAPPRRKATIVSQSPIQKLGTDTTELPGPQSTNSTITSVNSISSLLKEKLQLSIPQALWNSKKQQNANYRLRSFVGILFLCVVFLVGFAHIYYTKHVLQRAYFDKFRFNKNERVMHIYNNAGSEIIATRLGEGILADNGVFSCLPHHQRGDSVCLEWVQQTRLYLAHTQRENMDCYHVTWQSLSPYFHPKDCFDWSAKRGHWYGAGQIQNMAYPLEQGKLDLSPFITGDIRKHPFGNVLKRYFLNSKGATIVVDPNTPLYVSINANRTKNFCLQAKYDSFAYVNRLTPFPQLNYTICATDNIKSLHSSMAEKSLWDGLKPEELHAVHSLLSEPVWQISPTNEAAIYNYTEDVIALGFLRQGHVLLSEEWQPNPGDFVLDESRFPSMKETINIIHRRGFRIVFTIQPFISTESINFKDAVANRFLVSERGSDPRIPALTRYKQSNSAGVLDITNNKTLPWLQSNLESLVSKYHVDSFYLDLGTAQDIPHYYKCERPITNPDDYKTLFIKSILGSVSVIGVSGAISRPRAPVFVSLPPFPSSWKAIKTVIPTVLTYGMIGYPFIMPGAVGGDVALPMSDNNPDNDFEVSLPDKELYVRWLQLSTFLPVIRFTHLPSKYSDESVLEMAKNLTTLRQKTVTPLLKKYANETLDSGLPIIRPLWMLDPADPACHVVVDEFSVGEELIVAPILYSGSRQREVYLPAGVWRDGIDGSLRKGSRWIHNYRVAEDKVAYFVKMPDNTRF